MNFERIFREGIKRIKDENGIKDYISNIHKTFNNPNYRYLNDQSLDSKEKFNDEIDAQIKCVRQKRKTSDGKEHFCIYRVFEDKSHENIGFITCRKLIRKNGKILILNIKIFRDDECFTNSGGVSVIDELENLINNYFQNEKVKQVEFTCIKGNPMEKAYDKRFLDTQKYKSYKELKNNLFYYTILDSLSSHKI
jgi:hypothetical protein